MGQTYSDIAIKKVSISYIWAHVPQSSKKREQLLTGGNFEVIFLFGKEREGGKLLPSRDRKMVNKKLSPELTVVDHDVANSSA